MERSKGLHEYQEYCVQRLIDTPCIGLFLDMGLGKTLITLTALYRLKYDRFEKFKALVIAPKKVAEATWTTEAQKWPELSHLKFSVVLGAEKQRLEALGRTADVYVINRENTQWLAERFSREKWPFDIVILDESSSFKNPRSKRFRALRSVRPYIRRLIELTGTPAPQGYLDLWSQIYLLDCGKRLGRTIGQYRETYFQPDKRSRTQIFTYKLRDDAQKVIEEKISDICISLKAEDYLKLPDLIEDDICVKLGPEAMAMYKQMERTSILEFETGDEVTAFSAAALTGKLQQIAGGAVYDEEGGVLSLHSCKMDAFLETLERLDHEHVLVYYHYKHDLTRLQQVLAGSPRRVRVYQSAADADAWNHGDVDILLAQPASCGYGLNLQGGGHHVIWFSLTWNLEEYQQADKRLHRQGQEKPVFVHRLIVQNTVDEDIAKALESKGDIQAALLSALKARISKCKT